MHKVNLSWLSQSLNKLILIEVQDELVRLKVKSSRPIFEGQVGLG